MKVQAEHEHGLVAKMAQTQVGIADRSGEVGTELSRKEWEIGYFGSKRDEDGESWIVGSR
jgi:hypothetical protein